MKTRVLIGLAALMFLVGAIGLWQAWSVGSSDAATNHALVDVAKTAEVEQAADKALTAVLSYDHASPQVTEKAADTWLVGSARKEYETLYATLKQKAPEQELRLVAQVQSVGVKSLTDDSAKALVFLDQSSQRLTDKEASVSAAQLAVSLVKRDGTWKVSSLRPL